MTSFNLFGAAWDVLILSVLLSFAGNCLRGLFASKTSLGSRLLSVAISCLTLGLAFWYSFSKLPIDSSDFLPAFLKLLVLFALLVPSAYFVPKARHGATKYGSSVKGNWRKIGKAVVLYVVFIAIGVGVYALWLRFIA